MFNDFKGFDADGNPMKVSALPTLLISSIGIVNDAVHCQTMDFKETGDTLYLVGTPSEPVGGSLLSAELGANLASTIKSRPYRLDDPEGGASTAG